MNVSLKPVVVAIMICGMIIAGVSGEVVAGEIMVIANTGVPAKNLDQHAIQSIFLGKTIRWKNSKMVTIVVSEETEEHEMFLKKYIKRTKSQFNNVWRQHLFTGAGKQPVNFDSVEELIKYVSETDGAIGYVSSDTPLSDDVKVLAR